jgi:hypothetical protein
MGCAYPCDMPPLQGSSCRKQKRQPFALAKEDTHDTFFGDQPKKDN